MLWVSTRRVISLDWDQSVRARRAEPSERLIILLTEEKRCHCHLFLPRQSKPDTFFNPWPREI